MEQDEVVLEEGELSDSGDEYTPLERPANYSKTQPLPRLPVKNLSESEEEDQSDSDSDSDPNSKKVKKPKIRLKPQPQQRPQRNKKFEIWSNRLQEDTLAATLDNCDVVRKDRSRDVESYDYTVAHKYYENKFNVVERTNNKRRQADRNDAKFKQKRRSPSDDRDVKGAAKVISDLTADLNDKSEDIARDIANKLFEEKEELILKVINTMGKEKAVDIFNEVKKIEADGGMLIMNRTRRRTPGGVYLFLVRHDYHITPEQRNEIFGEERQNYKNYVKKKQKEKRQRLKQEIARSREKTFPDLLTRAELQLATQNPTRKVKETGDQDFVNPPPTPETDGYENSRDGMEGSASPLINSNDSLDNSRGKLNTYDDDFLDLGCADDMDLF